MGFHVPVLCHIAWHHQSRLWKRTVHYSAGSCFQWPQSNQTPNGDSDKASAVSMPRLCESCCFISLLNKDLLYLFYMLSSFPFALSKVLWVSGDQNPTKDCRCLAVAVTLLSKPSETVPRTVGDRVGDGWGRRGRRGPIRERSQQDHSQSALVIEPWVAASGGSPSSLSAIGWEPLLAAPPTTQLRPSGLCTLEKEGRSTPQAQGTGFVDKCPEDIPTILLSSLNLE